MTGKTVYNYLRNPGFDSTGEFADAWGNSSDRIRVRHSGQYLALEDDLNAVGKKLQQKYYEDSDAQQFMLFYAEDGYLEIRPFSAMDKCLGISTVGSDGYYRVTLQDTTASNSKKFKFVQTGTGYAIQNKNGLQFDVMYSSFVSGTDIIGTGTDGSALANNKIFIFEECSPRMASEVTYTADGRNVASVKDTRGFTVTSQYDEANRLLQSVTDAKGNSIAYTYNAQNDQLTGVSASVGSQTRSVSYTYDAGGRLKSISHNGTVYEYTYDGFGNQTKVTAGGNVLAEYTYLPGNGLLFEMRYGNEEVLKNVYDRQNRVTSQQWNGVTAFEYEYDDFGALEKHHDIEEGVEYQYRHDMTGRLVRQWTDHGQMLDIGYDEKNRVESIVQKLDDAKVKTGYLYGDPEAQERPGLLYGMEVDGVKRMSEVYDALGRRSGRALHLDNGVVRNLLYTYESVSDNRNTSPLLFGTSDGDRSRFYYYDANGNISHIVDGEKMISYQYDELNQLIREDNGVLGKTICYTYDLGGNMTSRIVMPPHFRSAASRTMSILRNAAHLLIVLRSMR